MRNVSGSHLDENNVALDQKRFYLSGGLYGISAIDSLLLFKNAYYIKTICSSSVLLEYICTLAMISSISVRAFPAAFHSVYP